MAAATTTRRPRRRLEGSVSDADDRFRRGRMRQRYETGRRDAKAGRARSERAEWNDEERAAYRQGHRDGEITRRRQAKAQRAGRQVVARTRPTVKAAKRTVRRGARELRNPFTETISTGSQALALSLGVVLLYLLLENADQVSGFFGFVSRGLRWLADPTASIPYEPSYGG